MIYGKERLSTCKPELIRLFERVAQTWDCECRCGHRGREAQDAAFASGASKLRWPDGPHNADPSTAADVYPHPVPDDKTSKGRATYYAFAGFVLGVAAEMGIKVRWGGDWDGDRDLLDQTFDDLVHFELKGD